MPAKRYSFLIQHLIPCPSKMLWNMLTNEMFEALSTVFISLSGFYPVNG